MGIAVLLVGTGLALGPDPDRSATSSSPTLSLVSSRAVVPPPAHEPFGAGGVGTPSALREPSLSVLSPSVRSVARMPSQRLGDQVTSATVSGLVVGNLDGFGPSPILADVDVVAYNTSCSASPPSPSSCPVSGTTTTDEAGEYSMNLPEGTHYYLAVRPDPSVSGNGYPAGFGGTVENVLVNGDTTVDLSVYPEVPYGNTTIVLPDYTCDSAYLDNYGDGGPGCQNPVLSWTQSGAYYLTGANRLAFYSFVNRTLYNLTAWTPLYQGFPDYAMIPNQLFITQDGSYIYGWGTLTTASTTLTVEAVNVTTDRLFEYNFTGVYTNNVKTNGQVELTGWDGNDSQLTLILANGSVIDHSLWSSSQRYVGKLDYFEANNVYWEPFLNGYINVQAEGSSNDGIEEWQLSGPEELNLTRTYSATWGSKIAVEGVNGVAFNVSSRELSVQAEWSGLTYAVNSAGVLTTLLEVTDEYPSGPPPAFPIGPASSSDRSELVASGPMPDGNYAGFSNDSWLISMTPGHTGFYSTNVSPYLPNGMLASVPVSSWLQWSQEGQFYNASYIIAPDSYACEKGFDGACTINGGEGAAKGTIWWMWKFGLPEFPAGATAPAADTTAPPATDIVSAKASETSIRLTWSPPDSTPLINYTVAWGTSTALTHSASVEPQGDSFTIQGLDPSTRYYFSVEAWNLHSHGGGAGVSSALTKPATYTVTFREKGLPAKTIWNVTVGTVTRSSTDSTIKFSELNGSYTATIGTPVSGAGSSSFSVEGSAIEVSVVFYHVSFVESGLPSGTSWNVTTNGVTLNSTGHRISFYLQNSSYTFRAVPDRIGYLNASGAFVVDGSNDTVPVKFTKSPLAPEPRLTVTRPVPAARRADTIALSLTSNQVALRADPEVLTKGGNIQSSGIQLLGPGGGAVR